MSGSPATPFSDNWTYLKTELQWLEKLLVLAIARRRQDDKVVNRLSKNQADKATSHWWQGLVTFDQQPAYDDAPAKQAMLKTAVVSTSKPSYQQQLEARIQASYQQGILLGLPLLRDQLGLSQFEKSIVLMAIAPEINQRYAKLYQSLQAIGRNCGYDLPTVDLALRLLCHNDQEWRAARMRLSSDSPLLRQGIVEFCSDPEEALLNYRLKLAPDWVNYLIADPPTVEQIRSLLGHELLSSPPATIPTTQWQDLVLPADLVAQVRSQASVLKSENSETQTGRILLLTGQSGSGKTAIAEALANEHQQPLWQVDLATLSTTEQQHLLQNADFQTAPVLTIDSSHLWFGRQSSPLQSSRYQHQQGHNSESEPIDSALLNRWLTQRQQTASVTFLTTPFLQSIRPTWRQQFDQVVQLSCPDVADRQTLWQRYLSEVEVAADFDWSNLARKAKLTAGEIQTVAQSAIALAQLDQSVIQWQHVQQALQQHGHRYRQR
ncbi:MAG: AAA family ATPase [Thainema sp.]